MNSNAHGPEKDVSCGKCKDWPERQVLRPDLPGEDNSELVAEDGRGRMVVRMERRLVIECRILLRIKLSRPA
jgi:hypothetical protein